MTKMTKTAIAFLSVFSLAVVPGPLAVTDCTADAVAAGQIIRIAGGMENCYLIVGDGQCVLVDTGSAKNRQKIYDAVKDYPVTLIVLTHGHYDHIQNAAFLAEKLGAKIAMHEDDAPLITDPAVQKTSGRSLLQKLFALLSNTSSRAVKIEPFEPDFYLSQGQDLAEYGVDGNIVELKGHTEGSVGVLLNDHKDFIVGDALMNIFKVTEPFLFENYDNLRASMKAIKESEATIYPGHGKCFKQS